MREDFFLVRLDMRLKRDDNESCQISVDRKTATCKVITCSQCFGLWSSDGLVEAEVCEGYEPVACYNRDHQN